MAHTEPTTYQTETASWGTSAAGSDETQRINASTRVFDTVELIEHIFHYLPSSEIVQARQISKYAKQLVQGSTKLHRSIFTNTDQVVVNHKYKEGVDWPDWQFDEVLYHGSWFKRFQRTKTPPLRICQVHPLVDAACIAEFDPSDCTLQLSCSSDQILEAAKSREWKASDYVLDGRYDGAVIQHVNDRDWKDRWETLTSSALTLGELWHCAAICRQEYGEGGGVGFDMRLYNHIPREHLDDNEWVEIRTCFQMPQSYSWVYESKESMDLKAAVEKAGRELCAHLKEDEIYPGPQEADDEYELEQLLSDSD